MQKKQIGTSGIEVSEICLGTMTWGTQNTTEEAFAQLDLSQDVGVDFMDTAHVYPVNPMHPDTFGATEEIIGEYFAARGNRKDWVVATKIAGASPGMKTPEITAETMLKSVDNSLKRLQTDYIDLFQLHWPNRGSYHFRQIWEYDPSTQPSKEAILENMRDVSEAMIALEKSGKVRAFGTSNETAWGMAQWQRVAQETGAPKMQSIQNEYSLLCRLYDGDLAEFAVHEEVSLLGYSCLGCGMLTGKYQGGKTIPEGSRLSLNGKLGGRTTAPAWKATQAYLDVAKKHDLDPTTMAIAWTLSRPFDVMPIIGGTSVEQLQKSLDASAMKLSDEVLSDIEKAHRDNAMPF